MGAQTQNLPTHEEQATLRPEAGLRQLQDGDEGMKRQVEAARRQHEEKAVALSRLEVRPGRRWQQGL